MTKAGHRGTGGRGHGKTAWALVLAAFFPTLAGCPATLGGVRPRIVPLPGSIVRTVDISADSATRALAAALALHHVPIAAVAPAEGYVESVWYDAAEGVPRSPDAGPMANIVKLRFFSDPTAGHARVVGEVVRRVIVDPSLPERELERIVPEGHPGRALLEMVLAAGLGLPRPAQEPVRRN